MSDVSPQPIKIGAAARVKDQKKQTIMVAVLGVVFLFVLVIFVLKPFGGGSDVPASAPEPAAPAATPAAPAPAGGGPAVSSGGPAAAAAGAAALPPAPARNRNPFDPPR
jgi:hypothetical protein